MAQQEAELEAELEPESEPEPSTEREQQPLGDPQSPPQERDVAAGGALHAAADSAEYGGGSKRRSEVSDENEEGRKAAVGSGDATETKSSASAADGQPSPASLYYQAPEEGTQDKLVPRVVTTVEAQRCLDTGEIDESTMVWAPGVRQDWAPLHEVLGEPPFSHLDMAVRKPLGDMVKHCNARWKRVLPKTGALSWTEEAHHLQWGSSSSSSSGSSGSEGASGEPQVSQGCPATTIAPGSTVASIIDEHSHLALSKVTAELAEAKRAVAAAEAMAARKLAETKAQHAASLKAKDEEMLLAANAAAAELDAVQEQIRVLIWTYKNRDVSDAEQHADGVQSRSQRAEEKGVGDLWSEAEAQNRRQHCAAAVIQARLRRRSAQQDMRTLLRAHTDRMREMRRRADAKLAFEITGVTENAEATQIERDKAWQQALQDGSQAQRNHLELEYAAKIKEAVDKISAATAAKLRTTEELVARRTEELLAEQSKSAKLLQQLDRARDMEYHWRGIAWKAVHQQSGSESVRDQPETRSTQRQKREHAQNSKERVRYAKSISQPSKHRGATSTRNGAGVYAARKTPREAFSPPRAPTGSPVRHPPPLPRSRTALEQHDQMGRQHDKQMHKTASRPRMQLPIVEPTLTLPDKRTRQQLFNRMDVNGNGGLSLAEIDKAVAEGLVGQALGHADFDNKPALMRAYMAADTSGDGFIQRSEFSKLLSYIVYFSNQWHRFADFDSDGDRRLNATEFAAGCAELGIRLSAAEAAAEFAACDTDGGGMILFDEWCTWCAVRDYKSQRARRAELRTQAPLPKSMARFQTTPKDQPDRAAAAAATAGSFVAIEEDPGGKAVGTVAVSDGDDTDRVMDQEATSAQAGDSGEADAGSFRQVQDKEDQKKQHGTVVAATDASSTVVRDGATETGTDAFTLSMAESDVDDDDQAETEPQRNDL